METSIITTFLREVCHPFYAFLIPLIHGFDFVLALRLASNCQVDWFYMRSADPYLEYVSLK